MIDTDKYIEDVEEKYNLIMNLMDDEEREFEIKTRIRLSNKMKAAIDKLDTEVKRLREDNETLRKMDWEYECLWTWLAENTNLLNTIEPLMEEWKKEYDEE